MRTLKFTAAMLAMAGTICLFTGAAAFGQELTRIGGFEHGAMFGAAVDGTDAYVGHGYYLQKLDISDPGAMVLVEELKMGGTPGAIELAGDHAYVMTYPGGLHVVDVSGSGPLAVVASYVPAGPARNFTLDGDTVYLVGDSGLVVLDVTDPADPDSLGSLALNFPLDVKAVGTTLYVFDEDGVHVVDASDPAAPVVLTSFGYLPQQYTSLGALLVHGDSLYIAYDDGIRVLDITSPQNPVPRNLANTYLAGMAIGASGNYVYVPTVSGLMVFNVSAPGIMGWEGTYDFGREEHYGGSFVVDGTTAYYANANWGLIVLDLTTPNAPVELGVYDVFGDFRLVDRQGDLAVVAGIPHIRLFDLSDPAHPDTLSTLPLVTGDADVQDVLLHLDLLYVMWDEVLRVYDVADPSAPDLIYQYDSPYVLQALAPEPGGPRVVISAQQRFLYLDMSSPSSPSMIVNGPNAYTPDRIVVHDGYIYVFNWIRVQVVDLDTPDQVCGSFSLPSPYSEMDGMAVDEVNDILFLGLELGHVIAVDISDPCQPVELGRTSVPEEVEGLAVRRGTQGEPGVVVLNKVDDELGSVFFLEFSDRANFVEVARYEGILATEEMVLEDDEILVTAGLFGFEVLRGDTFVPVTLGSLSAERRGGEVVVRWTLARSDERSSFHVYRVDGNGAPVRLNDSPLRGGSRFSFVDAAPPSGETVYRLEELDSGGGRRWLGSVTVAPLDAVARRPILHPNTPNPFAPSTQVEFDLPADGPVQLAVYDLAGRRVRVLLDGTRPAGRGRVEWDGRDDAGRLASSGVYFLELRTAGEVVRRRAVLAR